MTLREDKTLIVLLGGLFFFTCMVMIVVYTKDDVQLYALFSGVFGQFSGGLMMYLRVTPAAPPGSVTDTQIHRRTEVPQDPPA